MSKGKSNQHKDAEQSSKTRFYQAFFDSVKGKEVKVYRAGPEAKHGVVLDVQSDYVALAVKNSVIYYQAEHIKSVSSPTKPKPHHPEQEHKEKEKEKEKVNFLSAKNFRKLLKKMEQQVVQLNQGGPDSIHGKLLAVKHDFLIMHTEDDGHVYVSIHHVKSVSLSSKPFKEKEKKKDKMIEAHDLLGVFKHLENKWVAINRSGPEAVEGVLSVDDGYYKLTHNEEVILVDPFHVRSISSGPKKKKDKDKDKGKDKHDRKDGKKDGHDGKGKGKECDCKDCKKCCKCSGMDRFRDCKGNNNKDNDKDNDKDNSKSNKRCKDWFDKNSNKKDRGSMKSCNDDNRKNDNDKDNKDNNNDDDKDNNKDDNSKDNNNSNKDK